MGTRVDFYAGRGESAEWLGSYPWDGDPCSVFVDAPEMFAEPLPTEAEWRQWVAEFLAEQGDAPTTPDMGWPWPWDDSGTIDYAYAYEDGVIWGSYFGSAWFRLDPDDDEGYGQPEESDGEPAVFPDMSARKAVTLGRRSGVMVLSFGGDTAGGPG